MDLPVFYDFAKDWEQMMFLYDSALKQVNTKLDIMSNQFKLTDNYNPIEHITSRLKSPESIAKKLSHNQREISVANVVQYINDVAGVRIICSFESEIYKIAGLIKKQADITVLKVKDYIMFPKDNGYASYHMIISVPVYMEGRAIDTKVEIQIRTIAMDFWASLEHKIYYKFEGNAPATITKDLKECADIVAFLDRKMMAINNEVKTYKVSDKEDVVDVI
jgi:putative GTP pyrophosphokinase